ncbi:hypothetical protein CDIK_2487 [Cucumispora dikerogammari]|nr:hypothetical protein CDIK_2487 [Cucumispora dikerogammari]
MMLYIAIPINYKHTLDITGLKYIVSPASQYCDQSLENEPLYASFEITLDLISLQETFIKLLEKNTPNFFSRDVTYIKLNKQNQDLKLTINLQAKRVTGRREMVFEVSRYFSPNTLKNVALKLDLY